MSGISQSFGRQVRALRKARGMTQEQLGIAARIDYKHIGVIERGEKSPTLDTVERIARALKAEPYDFFVPRRQALDMLEVSERTVARRSHEIPPESLAQFLRDVVAAIQRVEAARSK